jgi:carbon monoxide dehydrogenase subunit G
MKFENDFTVQAPIEEVWKTLLDVERVAPCMPGAEVMERTGDNAYKVGIRVKVGPISMLYRGQVEITERDDSTHEAMMRAKAREARGQGTADAHIKMTLVPEREGAHATLATDLQLSGRAAAMGRGVIGDVASKLVETFAGNLAEMLAGPSAPAEAAPAQAEAAPAQAEAAPAQAEAAPAAAGNGASTEAVAAAAAPTEPSVPWPPPAPPTQTPAPATAAGAAAAPGPEAAPPPPPPPRQQPSGNDSLPVGKIAASVIAGRLENPRNLLIATGALGLTFGAIGYVLGKSR